jgi:hypothetical protein
MKSTEMLLIEYGSQAFAQTGGKRQRVIILLLVAENKLEGLMRPACHEFHSPELHSLLELETYCCRRSHAAPRTGAENISLRRQFSRPLLKKGSVENNGRFTDRASVL